MEHEAASRGEAARPEPELEGGIQAHDLDAIETRKLLADAAARAAAYLETRSATGVRPDEAAVTGLSRFHTPLDAAGTPPEAVLRALDEGVSPATIASTTGRFFGFVIGGALPVTLAANAMATAWDQNSAAGLLAPGTTALENVALAWLLDLLGLPPDAGAGFVTGATVANATALAAARHAVLERAGWDVEADGLFGAPPVRVVLGGEAHPTVRKSLGVLGLGKDRVEIVDVDDQGRLMADRLPRLDPSCILILQAGNVNTGAFDPFAEVVPAAHEAGAWVHVDGAFGLWAAASPDLRRLTTGMELADSWATDFHKWLNVPYDSGIAIVRDPTPLRAAMAVTAAYLPERTHRDPSDYTPELSRRARGVEVWAALKRLGRSGVEDLVERCCRHARRFADGLSEAGYEILNDVVLNQVLVSFGSRERTLEVIRSIQEDGTCWCGGTEWQGRAAMRISISSWATTDEDVERSIAAMVRLARGRG